MIIAIDGPAGSGKSTIARRLARKLNIEYIDSGAIYRTFTLFGMLTFEDGCQNHGDEIAAHLSGNPATVTISYQDHNQLMWLEQKNVTTLIRDLKVTAQVKYIADHQKCRELVNEKIRSIVNDYEAVIDGRDIGTIVFPDTPYKFYLDAKANVRAERRAKELGIEIGSAEFAELLISINQRDKNDMERKIAPLQQAEDACFVNSSNLGIEEVLEVILKQFQVSKNTFLKD